VAVAQENAYGDVASVPIKTPSAKKSILVIVSAPAVDAVAVIGMAAPRLNPAPAAGAVIAALSTFTVTAGVDVAVAPSL
jgi:hypothetical protein